MKFVCLIATFLLIGSAVDALIPSNRVLRTAEQVLQKHHNGDQEDNHLSDDERYDKALSMMIQAASNIQASLPLVSLNDFMLNVLNDVYANFNLFGYGMSQLYVREADYHLKGHKRPFHKYEHL